MRLRSGALAGAMALAATMSPENSLADQSCTGRNEIMTLRFAEIQQELKVAAAECRAASDYKRFVHAYKPALDLSDQAMLSVFHDNSVGDTGTSAYAVFKAQLVSTSLLRSARNKAAFCAEARSEFSAAFSGEGALETLISSSQPYVDLPFKDCAQNPQPAAPAPTTFAQQPPVTVSRQPVGMAQAVVAQTPVSPLSVRPDPVELMRIVPHHAPLVPAVPQMPRAAAVSAPAFPQFEISAPPPVQIARVVPHHTPFVPGVPAMDAPRGQSTEAPRFAITPDADPLVLARVVPRHSVFVPSTPSFVSPHDTDARAPHFAIARIEEPSFVRHVVPRRSALRPADLVLARPHAIAAEAPEVEIARVVPPLRPPHHVQDGSSEIARGLARLSAIAATALRHQVAASAAERPDHVRPMVPAAPPASDDMRSNPADGDEMALAAAQAADMLRAEPDAHPERRVAARQPLNEVTTRRRVMATNATLHISRATARPGFDQAVIVPTRAVHAPVQAPAPQSVAPANDQPAMVVAGRADVASSKLAHGFSAAKATTYGGASQPAPQPGTNAAIANTTRPAVQDAPSAALVPQDQDRDWSVDQGSGQNDDQQSSPNNNQDGEYGPAYAYDDGYYNARARARAWRRRIIDAYQTYRRRRVPDDYGGEIPPPPPWRNNNSDDNSWSDR